MSWGNVLCVASLVAMCVVQTHCCCGQPWSDWGQGVSKRPFNSTFMDSCHFWCKNSSDPISCYKDCSRCGCCQQYCQPYCHPPVGCCHMSNSDCVHHHYHLHNHCSQPCITYEQAPLLYID